MTAYITSVQQITVTIAAAATSGTATITSVNTNNAVIIWGGFTTSSLVVSNQDTLFPKITLTNGTTVTATANTTGARAITVYCTVIEFSSTNLLNSSVQYGSITLGSTVTSNTATITSVTAANSAVFYLGHTTTNAGADNSVSCADLSLTNATTVTASRVTGTGSVTINFVVVEFKSAVLQRLQQRAVAVTGANTTDTDTITSVTVANCMLAWGGFSTNLAAVTATQTDVFLSGATAVTFTRQLTTSCTRNIKYTVIEFVSGVLNTTAQHGRSVIATTQTVNDTTVTSTSLTNGFTGFLGNSFNSGATQWATTYASASLTSSTNERVQRNTLSATVTPGVGWYVVEFSASTSNTSTAALTEAGDVIAAVAVMNPAATAALTEAGDAISATALENFITSAALSEANDSIAASAKENFVTSAALQEIGDSISAAAAETFVTSAALAETADSISATATESLITSAALSEANDAISANVLEIFSTSAALQEADDSILASAVAGSGIVATAALVEDGDVINATANSANVVTSVYLPQLGHPPHKKRRGEIVWVDKPQVEQPVIAKPQPASVAPEAPKATPRKLHTFADLGEAFAGQIASASTVAENARVAAIENRKAENARILAAQAADDEDVIMAYLLTN